MRKKTALFGAICTLPTPIILPRQARDKPVEVEIKGCFMQVIAELEKRPRRTPDGSRETATAHCIDALRWLTAAEGAAKSRRENLGRGLDAVTVTRYPGVSPPSESRQGDAAAAEGGASQVESKTSSDSWSAAVRFGQGAPKTHLLLFLASKKAASKGARRATAALRTAARRAVLGGSSPEQVQVVEVQPSGQAARDLAKQFELIDSSAPPTPQAAAAAAKAAERRQARPTVRVATIGATLFRHAPPDEVVQALNDIMDLEDVAEDRDTGHSNHENRKDDSEDDELLNNRLVAVLIEWLKAIESGRDTPYLTAADRRVLLALMAHDKK